MVGLFMRLRALSTLVGLRGAPEVPPLCRETQSLGHQMLNAPVGINKYDRLMLFMCYHYYEYHHVANNCPNKSENPVCGHCALGHETKNCKSLAEKCLNCPRSRPNEPRNHSAFSCKCPCYITERDLLRQKTEYNDEKN